MNTALHRMSPAAVAVLALLVAPNADFADCGHMADRYSLALGRVREALGGYERCLARSAQRDNCADEMQALDDAHDAFSEAVADMKGCR